MRGPYSIRFAAKGSELKDIGMSPTRGKIQFPPDAVRVPEEPEIVETVKRCLCRVTLGADCYIVTGMTGDAKTIPHGAPISAWAPVCETLLELAMKAEML